MRAACSSLLKSTDSVLYDQTSTSYRRAKRLYALSVDRRFRAPLITAFRRTRFLPSDLPRDPPGSGQGSSEPFLPEAPMARWRGRREGRRTVITGRGRAGVRAKVEAALTALASALMSIRPPQIRRELKLLDTHPPPLPFLSLHTTHYTQLQHD